MGQRTWRRRIAAWQESKQVLEARIASRRAALESALRYPPGTFIPMPLPHQGWEPSSRETIAVSEHIRRLSQSRRARRLAFDEYAP